MNRTNTILPLIIFLFIVILQILSCLPISIFDIPNLDIVGSTIFYFSTHNKTKIHTLSLIALGVIADIILDYPFGISAIYYLSIYYIVNINVKFLNRRNFIITWMIYTFAVVISTFIKSLLLILLGLSIEYFYVILKILISILLYPILQYVYDKLFNLDSLNAR